MFRKGQAAMEFLMTYGWAILVVLVAIGALAYFGVLSPDRFLPSRCTLPAGIACTDHDVSSTNGVNIVLRNSLGYSIDTIVVSVGGCSSALTPGNDATLTNGEQDTWTGTASDCGIDAIGGQKFSKGFGISYKNIDSTLTHVVNGTLASRIS